MFYSHLRVLLEFSVAAALNSLLQVQQCGGNDDGSTNLYIANVEFYGRLQVLTR